MESVIAFLAFMVIYTLVLINFGLWWIAALTWIVLLLWIIIVGIGKHRQ